MLANTHLVTVEWGHCDPAGIVYFPNYFTYFDASTNALFLRALGCNKFEMLKRYGIVGIPLVVLFRNHEELDRLTAAGRFVAITYLTLAETYTLILRRLGMTYAQLQSAVGSTIYDGSVRGQLEKMRQELSLA